MKTIQGDILNGKWDYLIHICNLYHTWGAGFVLPLRKAYPEAYNADLATPKGCVDKLGTYSSSVVNDGRGIVVNLYAQVGIGNNGDPSKRNLRYDHLYNALYRLATWIKNDDARGSVIIGVPYLIGAGLSGGSAKIILAILEDIEEKFPQVNFNLYKLPEKR